MVYRVVADGCLRAIAYARDPRDAGEVAGRAEVLCGDARRYAVKRSDRAQLTDAEIVQTQLGRDWGRSRRNAATNRALCNHMDWGESK